jgi:hypothetical protein
MSSVCSGEKYNPTIKVWAKFADMCIPRAKFGTEVTDDVVFAIGGRDEIINMKYVKC